MQCCPSLRQTASSCNTVTLNSKPVSLLSESSLGDADSSAPPIPRGRNNGPLELSSGGVGAKLTLCRLSMAQGFKPDPNGYQHRASLHYAYQSNADAFLPTYKSSPLLSGQLPHTQFSRLILRSTFLAAFYTNLDHNGPFVEQQLFLSGSHPARENTQKSIRTTGRPRCKTYPRRNNRNCET